MKYLLIFALSILLINIQAQDKYWVTFNDKSASIYELENPSEFMSKNALARREKHGAKITDTDLPVCKSYVHQIAELDINIQKYSKWLNGIMVSTEDNTKIEEVKKMVFVKDVQKISTSNLKNSQNKFINNFKDSNSKTFDLDYGGALNQVEMLEGIFLHEMNYRGEGIEIAVMDNGFPNVDENRFFQKAFLDGRIKVGYDFVNDNDTIFDTGNGSHGCYTLSTMISDVPGEMIGTAPDATYYLFSTEDQYHEGLQEEYNWALAAEMADDLMGVNAIISTSLGYSNGFDDPTTEHTYSDMNGNTTPITIAADLAASKGFLVINSAGNSGNDSWHYITAPSDGDSVLCIGAVDTKGVIASFSSRGPSADGRIKPNICTKGKNATVISPDEKVKLSNGTSFSCPIAAGMAASLWQVYPEKTNMQIFNAIEKSSHLFSEPNDDYGFGIPNFSIAYKMLKTEDFVDDFILLLNPITEVLDFYYLPKNNNSTYFNLIISKSSGEVVLNKKIERENQFNLYSIKNVEEFPIGVYYILIQNDNKFVKSKFIKE